MTAVPSPSTPSPQGVHVTNDSYVESPLRKVLPVSLAQPFTIIIGLQSRKVNSAFLFSIRSKNRLQLGVQLLPKRLVVHLGGTQAVNFSHSVHDGRRHALAIAVSHRAVSMFAECGGKSFRRETLADAQTFDSNSVFTLGSLSSDSARFEGVLCQLDIIPSVEAPANYCRYVRRQCRPATSLLHSTIVPAEIPENSPLPKRSAAKPLSEDPFPAGKGGPDVTSSDSAAVRKQRKHQPSGSQLTSHSGNVSAVGLMNHGIQTKEMIPEQLAQTNASLPVTHRSLSEARAKSTERLSSLPNASDDTAQRSDPAPALSPLKKVSPTRPHRKQDTPLRKAIAANLHTNELTELQRILNTTFYRRSEEPSAGSPPDLRKEGGLDPDAADPMDSSHETRQNDDCSDDEHLNAVLEMENLRGPKGDPGPPVSCRF